MFETKVSDLLTILFKLELNQHMKNHLQCISIGMSAVLLSRSEYLQAKKFVSGAVVDSTYTLAQYKRLNKNKTP